KTLKLPPAADSTRVTGLANGLVYRVALLAVSIVGRSISATSTGKPSRLVVPGVPQSLRVVPDGKGDLAVTWTAPSDPGNFAITGYRLNYQQQTSDGTTWTPNGKLHVVIVSGSVRSKVLPRLSGFFTVSLAAYSQAGIGPVISTSDPVTPSIIARSGTIVLSQPTMDALASFTAGDLSWHTPGPRQVSTLKPGQILIGPASPSAPSGLLASVKKIASGQSMVVVTTGPASLSQAFRDLTFSTSGSPLASSSAKFTPFVAGIRGLSERPHLSVSLSRSFGFNLGAGPLKVSGSTSLSANLNLSASIITGWLHIPNGVSLPSSATVSASASLQASISGNSTWKF